MVARVAKELVDILWVIAIIVVVIIAVILLIIPGLLFVGGLIFIEIRNNFREKKSLAAQKKEQSWVDQEPEDIFLTYRTGFRTWNIKKDGDKFVLSSQFSLAKSWPKREKFVAQCGSRKDHHEAPFPTCSCGVYVIHSKEYIKNRRKDITRCTFLGEVKIWGVILRYTEGLRAQFAYPLSITEVQCNMCEWYIGVGKASYYYSSEYPGGVIAFCANDDSDTARDSAYSFEKLDPSFLTQIAEDYGITIEEVRV